MTCICGKFEKQYGNELCKNCWQPEGEEDQLSKLKKMFGMT